MDVKGSFLGFVGLAVFCLLFLSGCVQNGGDVSENISIEGNVTVTDAAPTTSSTSVASTTSLKPVTTVPAPSTSTTTTSLVIPSVVATVFIVNHSFVPGNLTVRVGTVVTWVNNDSAEHQVISDIGFAGQSGGFSRQLFDLKSKRMYKGAVYSYRFQRVGNFTYHCNVYPQIRGGVLVVG